MLHVEELIYLERCGCPYAQEYLFEWIKVQIRKVINSTRNFKNDAVDYDEMFQLCLIHSIDSIDSYRQDKYLFSTYITTVIKNRYFNYFKRGLTVEKRYHDNVVYLDAVNENGYSILDSIEDKRTKYMPRDVVVIKEDELRYNDFVDKNLSIIEQKICFYRKTGYKVEEIAALLKVDCRVVYNATYRIQKKLSKLNLFD